jgi:glycosidase
MLKQILHKSLPVCILATGLLSCTQNAGKEEIFDTQYLPEGVEVSPYRAYSPTGENFQSPRVEPPFWWIGMQHQELELLIYDKDIAAMDVVIEHPGIQQLQTKRLENPNYLFVKLSIAPIAQPGKFIIELLENGESFKQLSYELKSRDFRPGRINPIDPSDVMYLIMPDRFANGDTTNDSIEGLRQTGIDRSKMYFRHGGDLQGIIDHLDYLNELGVTALWLNPVYENNQPYASYHGYAVTDHYKIDPRFGTNEKFIELAIACEEKGIKLIKDIIPNHSGDYHWFIQDIPSSDWIHQFETFTRSNHSHPTVNDPYAAEHDKSEFLKGWFDYSMPDLNQMHPQLANYLIQSYIWWIEYAGIDGYRIDTYHYSYLSFLKNLGERILLEYPDYIFFAESSAPTVAHLAHFTIESPIGIDEPVLPSVLDFMVAAGIKECLTQKTGWTNGIHTLYTTIASDFLYNNPYLNVTFLDNHDSHRFLSVIGEDFKKWKAGLTLLLTTRGIPCLYYGTELLFKNFSDPDGKVRQDFPGGWPGDLTNKFEESGRNPIEQEAFEFTRALTHLRTKHNAFTYGKLVQYSPHGNEGIYVFFRSSDSENYMIAFNANPEAKEIDLARFAESILGAETGSNALSGDRVDLTVPLSVPGHTTLVIKIK